MVVVDLTVCSQCAGLQSHRTAGVIMCHFRFAFVEFSDIAATDEVLNQQAWELDGRQLYLDRAGSGGGGGSGSDRGRGGSRGRGGGDRGRSQLQRMYHISSLQLLLQVLIVTNYLFLCRILGSGNPLIVVRLICVCLCNNSYCLLFQIALCSHVQCFWLHNVMVMVSNVWFTGSAFNHVLHVSTWKGDHLWACKPFWYVIQFSSAWPSLHGWVQWPCVAYWGWCI